MHPDKVVFHSSWEETLIVFKTSYKINDGFFDPDWFHAAGLKHHPDEVEFETVLYDLAGDKLNISISHDQMKRLGRLRFSKAKDKLERRIEMQNIWYLLLSNEYMYSILYADRDIFPLLIGTCGPFFAVEYLEPVKSSSGVLSALDVDGGWSHKIRLAVLIMDLMDELETRVPDPLHLCDIKLGHFGFAKGAQRLKILDLEAVFPRNIVNHIMRKKLRCTHDDDCDFYDCRSRCNQETHRCDFGVTNNNLQVVCEKIFLGWILSGTVVIPGLLMSQKTPPSLAALLRMCANPDNQIGSVSRSAVHQDTQRRLYATLTEMQFMYENNVFV